jgi:hypothetical protein
MKTTAIVPYKSKRERRQELYEKRCANLAKAREARGKLSTKLKQINRAQSRIAKASTTALLRSVTSICKILANGVPLLLEKIAAQIPTQKELKKIRREAKLLEKKS